VTATAVTRRAAACVIVVAAAGAGRPAAAQSAYALPHTEVRRLHSARLDREVVLYVSLPRHYAETAARYPVLFTLDADYAFALAHNIVEHFVDRGDLPPLIVVGLAYEGASQDIPTYRRHRTRDYTPTHTLEGGYGPEFQAVSGGGEAHLAALAEEVLPYVDREFRTRPEDRTLVGHSYGGLFSTYALLTRPELFRRYIIVSPSLWYDRRVAFRIERAFARSHRRLDARVFLSVGGLENGGYRMVSDLLAFERVLRSRHYAGLRIVRHVFPGETHNSVFPAALSRGLRAVFATTP